MDNLEPAEFLSCAQVRSVDQFAIEKVGISGLVLMENAARGCVDLLTNRIGRGGVAVVCGKGNNGGDGFAMVRHLLVRGISAKAIVLGDPQQLRGDALENYEVLKRIAPLTIEAAEESYDEILGQLVEVQDKPTEWIVDALLGTGTQGEVREPFASIIELINVSAAKVFAVDIPSGLDGDTGDSLGHTVKADLTGTFVSKKTGFRNPDAHPYLGEVHVLDIGIPESVIQQSLREGVA